jgi:hypothetical protein
VNFFFAGHPPMRVMRRNSDGFSGFDEEWNSVNFDAPGSFDTQVETMKIVNRWKRLDDNILRPQKEVEAVYHRNRRCHIVICVRREPKIWIVFYIHKNSEVRLNNTAIGPLFLI